MHMPSPSNKSSWSTTASPFLSSTPKVNLFELRYQGPAPASSDFLATFLAIPRGVDESDVPSELLCGNCSRRAPRAVAICF